MALRSLRSLTASTMRILNVRERGLGKGWEATFLVAAATFAFAVLFPSKCDIVDPFGPFVPGFGVCLFPAPPARFGRT